MPWKLTFLILFLTITCCGQKTNIDSLYQLLNSASKSSEKSRLEVELGDAFFLNNNDSAIIHYEKAYVLCAQSNDDYLIAKSAARLGQSYQYIDQIKSTEYVLIAVEHADKTDDDYLISFCHNVLGSLYQSKGNTKAAMKEYDLVLEMAIKSKDSLNIASAYNQIGIIHMIEGDYDIGLEYWQKSLNIKLAVKEMVLAATTMSNIGLYYKDINRFSDAKIYITQALNIQLEVGNYESVSFNYTILGELYEKQGEFDEAVKLYQKSLDYSDSTGSYFDKNDALKGLSNSLEQLGRYKEALEVQKEYVALIAKYNDETNKRITEELTTKFDSEKKQKDNELLQAENIKKDQKIKLEQEKSAHEATNNKYLMYGLLIISLGLIAIIYFLNKVRKAKKLVEAQNTIIEHQREEAKQKNDEILDSIKYAQRIQSAILPTHDLMNSAFNDSFVLYKPKDIVAGDFYWVEPQGDQVVFAVADCTGHGVPGAMVSVVCNNGLNRSVREYGLKAPHKILDKTREIVIQEFGESFGGIKDGMDISLCSINFNEMKLSFAGANNPVWLIRQNQLIELKGDKQPVGNYHHAQPFSGHELALQSGDLIYLFSDGYADQFGGPKAKKFKSKNLKQLFIEIHTLDFSEQELRLIDVLEKWQGDIEQLDDICIMGIRI